MNQPAYFVNLDLFTNQAITALNGGAREGRSAVRTFDLQKFILTSTSVGPRAPAGRPGSTQSGHWALPAGLGHQKARPGLDGPKSPRAARGPAGLLRPLYTSM
jgi:hypothetical protein